MPQLTYLESTKADKQQNVSTARRRKFLLVTSSPCGRDADSVMVARRLATDLVALHPGASLGERNLDLDYPPHFSKDFVSGRPASATRAEARAATMARAGAYVDELFDADVIVIASGMMNMSLSTPLKAWFDHVLVPGLTFSYRNGCPDGLLKGKKVYLVLGSGGIYSAGPLQPYDFHEPYILAMLDIMGISNIDVIRIEGGALGPEAAANAIAAALARVAALIEQSH